jgi:recombination protein RecT
MMSERAQQPPATQGTIKDLLVRAQGRIAAVLPRHLRPEKMLRLATVELAKNPRLGECEPMSVLSAVVDASRLGLEIGTHAHLVPYNIKGRMMCQMIPDYKGLIALAMRGGVKSIYAEVVYACDTFKVQKGTSPLIVHMPDLKGSRKQDEIEAFYSVAVLEDGLVDFDVMTKDEVDKIRDRSKAKSSGPWVTDFVEMGKKTVMKRHLKTLPSSTELLEAVEIDHKAAMGEITSEDHIALQTERRTAALEGELLDALPKGEEKPDDGRDTAGERVPADAGDAGGSLL